jgi:hypothetical protein
VAGQAALLQRSGGRAIEVPLDLGDFGHWLQGRATNATDRALDCNTAWPPITKPGNIGGESDFIDYGRCGRHTEQAVARQLFSSVPTQRSIISERTTGDPDVSSEPKN